MRRLAGLDRRFHLNRSIAAFGKRIVARVSSFDEKLRFFHGAVRLVARMLSGWRCVTPE